MDRKLIALATVLVARHGVVEARVKILAMLKEHEDHLWRQAVRCLPTAQRRSWVKATIKPMERVIDTYLPI